MSIVDAALQRLKANQAAERRRLPAGDPPATSPVARQQPVPARDPLSQADPESVAAQVRFSASNESLPSLAGGDARLAGQFRAAKRTILTHLREVRAAGRAPIVLITSAAPGDGKTFVTVNLAMSFARERDVEVTLVDADLARRQASAAFGATTNAGLGDCLVGHRTISGVRAKSDVQGLHLLPAGLADGNVSELLTSSAWDGVAASLAACGPGHVFIVDSAPVLATGEATYLAQAADVVVFVVRAGQTPAGIVGEAVRRLDASAKVMLMLNGASATSELVSDYYYHYGEPTDRSSGSASR